MAQKDKIKSAFHKEVPTWNPEDTWVKIEHSLPSKKKKRVMFWCFTLLSAITYVSYVLMSNANINYIKKIKNVTLRVSEADSCIIDKVQELKSQFAQKRNMNLKKTNYESSKNISIVTNVPEMLNIQDFKSSINPIKTESIMIDTSQGFKFNRNSENGIDKDVNYYNQPLTELLQTRNQFLKYNNRIPCLLNNFMDKNANIKSFWSASISAGMNFTFRKIKSDQGEPTEFIIRKTKSEKPQETFSHDIEITYHYNHLFFSTGIRYNRTTELFTSQDVTTLSQQILSDSAYFIQNKGIKTYFKGSLNRKITQGIDIKSPNVLTRYYIPLSLGYQINLGRRMKLYPYIGYNLNFYSRYHGISINDTLQFIYKDKEKFGNLYVSSGNHSYFAAIKAEIYHKKYWNIFVNVRYQHDLNSIIRKEKNINLTYSTLGLNVGLTYNFLK